MGQIESQNRRTGPRTTVLEWLDNGAAAAGRAAGAMGGNAAATPDWANWDRGISLLQNDQRKFAERMAEAAAALRRAEPGALPEDSDSHTDEEEAAVNMAEFFQVLSCDANETHAIATAFDAFRKAFVAYESFAYLYVPQTFDGPAFSEFGGRIDFTTPLLHHLPATIAALLAMDAAVVRGHLSEMLANLNLNHDAGQNASITWLVPSETESGQPTSLTFVPADFNSWSALMLVVLEVWHAIVNTDWFSLLMRPPQASLPTHDPLTTNAILDGVVVCLRAPTARATGSASASSSSSASGNGGGGAGEATNARSPAGGGTSGTSASASASAPVEERCVRSRRLNADLRRLHRIDPYAEYSGGRKFRATYVDASNAHSVFEYTVRTVGLLLTAIHFDTNSHWELTGTEKFMDVRVDLLRRILGARGRWPSRN